MAEDIEASFAGLREFPNQLYEGHIFDLDGTKHLGDELLTGAKRLILKLRDLGKKVVFLSNDPTKDPEMYAKKLTNLGIETPASEIINTVVSMTRWLSENHPDATVFPISEEPLKRALKEASIRIPERAEEIDIVVAIYDRSFNYHKLQIVFDAVWYHKRAPLVTINPDRYCPFLGGRGEPDAAAIVAAIEACTCARRSDYAIAFRLIESGRVDVSDMVNHRFPLADAAKAIEASAGGGGIKVAVMP